MPWYIFDKIFETFNKSSFTATFLLLVHWWLAWAEKHWNVEKRFGPLGSQWNSDKHGFRVLPRLSPTMSPQIGMFSTIITVAVRFADHIFPLFSVRFSAISRISLFPSSAIFALPELGAINPCVDLRLDCVLHEACLLWGHSTPDPCSWRWNQCCIFNLVISAIVPRPL